MHVSLFQIISNEQDNKNLNKSCRFSLAHSPRALCSSMHLAYADTRESAGESICKLAVRWSAASLADPSLTTTASSKVSGSMCVSTTPRMKPIGRSLLCYLSIRVSLYAPLQVFPLYVSQTQSWHSQRGPKNFPGSVAWQRQMPQSHLPLPLQILPSGVLQRRRDDSVDSLHTPPTWLGKRMKVSFLM